MENFVFHANTEIFFGKKQIENLPNILNRYGKNGIYEKIYELLNDFNIVELEGIEPNPRIGTVKKGIELCKENNVDVVLAVGGGSTIDCSKLVSTGYYYNDNPWDLVKDSTKITNALPLVTVLTLAATGSEMNSNAVISNPETNEKLGVHSNYFLPKASILDPEYTYSLPTIQTAAGTADIMSHVIEQYFNSTEGTYIQDKFCESLLKTCIKYCPIALSEPTNYEARANLMWASSMALNGICGRGKTGDWSCHPIEHELSAFYDITHGVGLAIITPRWMRHILSEKTINKFVEYAVNVWNIPMSDNRFEIAEAGIKATEEFFTKCGIPMNLGKLGIDDALIEKMASAVLKHEPFDNAYVPLKQEDICAILKNSL